MLPPLIATAQPVPSANPPQWLRTYSTGTFIWTTIPIRAPHEAYQTGVFLLPESGDVHLRPTSSNRTFSHVEFNVCLLTDDDKMMPAKGDDPPYWHFAPSRKTKPSARITVKMDYDVVLMEKTISQLHVDTHVSVTLPKPSSLSGHTINIEVDLGEHTRAMIYRLAPVTHKKTPRHVVLISLDTHALQHMSLSSPKNKNLDTSPTLRNLVKHDPNAVAFTGAIGTADWTLPTHATVFTGLYPSQHQLTDRKQMLCLSKDVATLPETLHRQGIATAHLCSHTRVGFRYGYHRSTDVYRRYESQLGKRGRLLLKDAVNLIDECRDRDLFLFCHLFDAHIPYTNYPADYTNYYRGTKPAYHKDIFYGKLYRTRIYGDKGWYPTKREEHVVDFGPQIYPQMPSSLAAYQLGIRDVDDMLNTFITNLKKRGLYENCSFIIFADHGEEFFDHGLLTHSSLYCENINIPMVVRLAPNSPSAASYAKNEDFVPYLFEAHTTVHRCVLDMFSASTPSYLARANTEALTLRELLALSNNHAAFSEMHMQPTDTYYEVSLVDTSGRQLITSAMQKGRDIDWFQDGKFTRLYDLRKDPTNAKDLFSQTDESHLALRVQAINKAKAVRKVRFVPMARETLSTEQINKLRDLGYIQ